MRFIVLTMLVLTILATGASAALDIIDSDVTIQANYADFSDKDEDFIVVSGSFIVQNDAGAAESTSVSIDLLGSTYSVASGEGDVSIAANSNQTINFQINVPHENDQGTEKIGTITAAGETIDLFQETARMFEVRKFEVDYTNDDDKSESDDFSDSDDDWTLSDPILPGTEVTITVELENLFQNDYDRDGELKDIEVILEETDEDIVDEEENYEDIEADDRGEDLEITFDVDDDIDEGDYTIDIEIVAEDDTGAKYTYTQELDFEIQRQDDDVRIESARFLNEPLNSCDETATLEVTIQNHGTDDQDDVTLAVTNSNLRYSERVDNIELEEFDDNDNDRTQLFTIDIASLDEGREQFDVRVYINRDDLEDTEIVNLDLVSCNSDSTSTTTTTTTSGSSGTTTTTTTGTTTPSSDTTSTAQDDDTTTSTVEPRYTNSDFVVAAAIVGIVLVVAIAIMLVVLMARRN